MTPVRIMRAYQADEDDFPLGQDQGSALAGCLPFPMEMGRKEADAEADEDGAGNHDDFPVKAQVEQGSKKGSAGEIPQGPHGLQAGHEALVDFPFNEDTVDVDDDVEQSQGRTEEDGHDQGRCIRRHITENVQDNGNGQAGDGQRTAAAQAPGKGPGQHHHDRGA